MTTYAEIEPVEADPLWGNWLVFGETALLVGDSGVGKGQICADLTGRITTGREMPDGETYSPKGSVILVTPEDQASTTTAFRLRAAGADLSMVIDLSYVVRSDPMSGTIRATFTLPDDIGILRQAVEAQGDVRMVWIDPLDAVSGVSTTANRTVREKIVAPLQRLARETGVAVVLVHHPTKTGAKTLNLKDGASGSKGLTSAVRLVHGIVKDPETSECTLMNVKTNITERPEPLRYVLEGTWPDIQVKWLEAEPEPIPEGDGVEPAEGSDTWKVLTAVREHGGELGAQEIALKAGVAYDTTRVLLSRLKARGLVEQPSRGMFRAAGVTSSPDQEESPIVGVSLQ